jgi:hypothetical protein
MKLIMLSENLFQTLRCYTISSFIKIDKFYIFIKLGASLFWQVGATSLSEMPHHLAK